MENPNRLTRDVQVVLETALRAAGESGTAVTTYHMLLAMRDHPLVAEVVTETDMVLVEAAIRDLDEAPLELDELASEVLDDAESIADRVADPYVSVEHLLAAMGGCGILPGRIGQPDVVRAAVTRRRALRVSPPAPAPSPMDALTTESLLDMEALLHERVISQHSAVTGVSHAIRRAVAGLSDERRPFGSFLFLGPTGVGKTELAKALAVFLYGHERLMTRFDMSEYREEHTIAKLIGSPPGYVGYNEGGQLTNAVKKHPQSLILFDEMEKANPHVLNALLQVLDDGRMTSGQGETVDFTQTVVVMTSNVGSHLYAGSLSAEQLKGAVLEELWYQFRPEFLNRIDEMIVFDALTKDDFVQICDLQLVPIARRLEARRLSLTVTSPAKQYLIDGGWNPVLGARQLRRFVQRQVQDPLAQRLLREDWRDGQIVVGLRGKELSFRLEAARG